MRIVATNLPGVAPIPFGLDVRYERPPGTSVAATDETRAWRAYLHGMNVAGRVAGDRALGYWCSRVAGLLRQRGGGPGTVVAMMLPHVPEFGIVAYGVLWAGGLLAPLPPGLAADAIAARTRDAAFLFAWHAGAEVAEAATDRSGTQCVFVVPGEFQRLLRTVAPMPDPVPRNAADPALILPGSTVTHGDLARRPGIPDLPAFTRDSRSI